MQEKTIHITLPNGAVKRFPKGITGLAIAQSIHEGLARQVLAAVVNGEVWEATREIYQDATVKLLTWDDEEGKSAFWHSSAHLMAEA
ncbi:MAG: TGS domain-containing protein, partial [Cytophagales bacterium]|nr:TGS domain-containing protein [Cytophagales bacterium]